ncbi:MAG: hypothetical protein KGN39_02175 [Betaproteobacteria bacterium]|nr:hypothetical protein [Betaproteobacteria bacterium]
MTLGAGTPISLLFNGAGISPSLAQLEAASTAAAGANAAPGPLLSVSLPNNAGPVLVLGATAANTPAVPATAASTVGGTTAPAEATPAAANTPSLGETAFSRFQSLLNDTSTLAINSVAGDAGYAAAAAALYLSTAVFRFQHGDLLANPAAANPLVNPIEKSAPSHSA